MLWSHYIPQVQLGLGLVNLRVGNLSGVLGSSINDLESIHPAIFARVAVQFITFRKQE